MSASNLCQFVTIMKPITLATAIVVSEKSRSTWLRRIADGSIERLPDEGGRTMVSMTAVREMLASPLCDEDWDVLGQADAGDPGAQSELGQLFSATGKPAIALHFLRAAAEQNEADAMQYLGRMYAAGEGVEKDERVAMVWIAKAASHGSVIANAQLSGLLPRAANT